MLLDHCTALYSRFVQNQKYEKNTQQREVTVGKAAQVTREIRGRKGARRAWKEWREVAVGSVSSGGSCQKGSDKSKK